MFTSHVCVSFGMDLLQFTSSLTACNSLTHPEIHFITMAMPIRDTQLPYPRLMLADHHEGQNARIQPSKKLQNVKNYKFSQKDFSRVLPVFLYLLNFWQARFLFEVSGHESRQRLTVMYQGTNVTLQDKKDNVM